MHHASLYASCPHSLHHMIVLTIAMKRIMRDSCIVEYDIHVSGKHRCPVCDQLLSIYGIRKYIIKLHVYYELKISV